MTFEELINAAPPVTYEMFMTALQRLVCHYVEDETQDFLDRDRPNGHVFFAWVMIMTWLHRNKHVQ